ncbi:MAG TPA: 1-deoxy-D-xylulose-5-phosphate synthase [Thermoguttaceae bacterium]|nr:1-deoxy-D-xylulose-5-phosphate synthase [Thermoguttaceae bacterium]
MDSLLAQIHSPADLQGLSQAQLTQLAAEMREALCRLVSTRSAHFASNLGVVELSLALHTTFDFSHDRLIWDTGHQIYPHKMLTGRFGQFDTIRAKGGLMGYPNPNESPYDLFMTGHAGCSVSTAVGLRCADDQLTPDQPRHVVAVIGDGAFSCGTVFEAMNHAGALKKELTVVLNDNMMSICPRVGSLGDYLDRLRMTTFYTGLKSEIQRLLNKVPVVGDPVERFLTQIKDAVKAGTLGGMLFEELGFRYLGPVDGHNIPQLQKYLRMARDFEWPVLLHVVTEKGHGFQPAADDPRSFHAPAPFVESNGSLSFQKKPGRPYTEVARDTLLDAMQHDSRVAVITAAMCQGNQLEPVRDAFPERFFDVGICESHAVAFAAGLARSGMRPVVDIYSTFMQRAYDQIFQEMALQDLPVVLMMDRAGLTGPDGPTHHGMFDLTYLRPLPNLVVMAPGDAWDLEAMIRFALACDHPTAIRYPKAMAETVETEQPRADVRLGRAEVLSTGEDGTIVACGGPLSDCLRAAEQLRDEGLDFGVINARFVKPLDAETLLDAVERSPLVVTVEEGSLAGGFGSALLEAAGAAGLDASHVRRLGVPDRFVEHGSRAELLADLGLDAPGIAASCLALIRQRTPVGQAVPDK